MKSLTEIRVSFLLQDSLKMKLCYLQWTKQKQQNFEKFVIEKGRLEKFHWKRNMSIL